VRRDDLQAAELGDLLDAHKNGRWFPCRVVKRAARSRHADTLVVLVDGRGRRRINSANLRKRPGPATT